jgi:hypothetical protein
MAIRRPAIASPEWLFQDFLFNQPDPETEERYIQVKWDGEEYTRVSQSFDYSNPPFQGSEQRGGHIVAQLDYTIVDELVTITSWNFNWQDEWPLRLAINYLKNCLYPQFKGYVIRVVGDEVYSQDGTPIPVANKNPDAFWVSENFLPLTNEPYDYLMR